MKKFITLIAFLILFTACSNESIVSSKQTVKSINTENGTIVFQNLSMPTVLCTKDKLDYLEHFNTNGAFVKEFRIKDYAQQLTEKEFIPLNQADTSCQYNIEYLNLDNDNNYVVLKTMDLKAGEQVNPSDMAMNQKFKDFIDKNTNLVNDRVVSYLLSQLAVNPSSVLVSSNENLEVKTTGKYQLRAYPQFKVFKFVDRKKIYDFQFDTVTGLKFTLEKIS